MPSPVITIFAPSRFKGQAPFGTGRVFLETLDGKLSDTAMLIRVRTTLGLIVFLAHSGETMCWRGRRRSTTVSLSFRAKRGISLCVKVEEISGLDSSLRSE
jgi:hypothetical protein